MFYIDGVGYVSNDSQFVDATGTHHPAGYFSGKSLEEIAAIGAVPVVHGEKPDERIYAATEQRNGASITYQSTLRTDLLARKLEALASHRWQIECGGIEVGGEVIPTDDRAKLLIHGKYTRAKENPALTFKWKAAGGFTMIDSATIIAIGDAVEAHVQSCFDNEEVHATAIAALAAAEDWVALVEYDISTGWPAVPGSQE